ncbi:phage portal protein [Litoribacter alkaliphilus]|uniref:Phage portal protein n=1 Tax=Litoribacter ruber TaxID=702568 RepID=A0AAP2G5V3_9BACT|nr:phage portal protein [Litoribacter alkaliphilus]MBS9525920.1 phage portal protein [Litoribacter alkaliphilus]
MNFRNLFTNTLPSITTIQEITLENIAGGVSAGSALTLSAFYQGVSTISNTVSSLPFKVYKDKELQKQSDIYFLLKEKPNRFQTAFEFFNTMLFLMQVKGNSFAKIIRGANGDVLELRIIDFESVEAIIFEDKLYFKFNGDKDKILSDSDVIHFKNIGSGYLGIDTVNNFRRNIEVNLNALEYTNKVYNGEASSIRGTITYDKALDDKQRERLRKELQSNFSGKGGKRILFLEDGMKLDNTNLDPSQTKFLESRSFEKSEIASMLNVPPYIVGDYSTNYANVEAQNLHFYKQTLLPIITKIEAELKHKLFSRSEILSGYYVKCNVEGLLRGDSKSRAEFYKELFYLGAISSEEIREKEDMNEEVVGTTYIHSNLIPSEVSKDFWLGKVVKDNAKAKLDEANAENE